MNALKQALAAGQTQIGLWQALANPYTAEICAGAGFDWLLFDAEHAPNDVRSLLAQLQAVAPYAVEPVVRVASDDPVAIKKTLDIGAISLLIPMVESGEQAASIVQAATYPPAGTRGVAATTSRATRWGRDPAYLDEAGERIFLALQIESRGGIDAVEDIAGTSGVDAVFIGPADLAASLGHLGDPGHAEVQEAIAHVMRCVRQAGKAVGVLAGEPSSIRRYLDWGATLVAVGTDVTLLARSAESLAQRYRPE